MAMNKKIISKMLALIICAALCFSFSACSSKSNREQADDKIKIVCTIFPEYDWVKQISKNNENIELTYLLVNGVDLHNYQPSADDIITISNCDMFIYVGGESDSWVDDVLDSAKNEHLVTINLIDVLGSSVKEEEIKEGMESENEEDGDEGEYDEHIWLSLKNAKIVCRYISDKLCKIDSKNEKLYISNTESYLKELDDLDSKYQNAVDNSETKTLLFGDRFPFRYLTDDYGLDYYAAFAGCSAETEASFETITYLAKKADELNLNTVMTIDGSDNKIAQTIISNTKNKNQKILSLNSMQSTLSENDTYLSVMQSNLTVLEEALG